MLGRSLALALSTALVGGTALAQPAAPGAPPPPNAAASPSPSAGTPNPDPWEGFNRKVFALFQAVDRSVLRPAALGYQRIMPEPLRTGLHNAISNSREPVVFVNDVLQARPKDAGTTLGRFIVNSTVGLAGLVDVGTGAGLPHHDNGFGTTLGRYGTPPGPYLFLAGPSDVRDTIGSGVDILTDPLTWIRFSARTGLSISRGVIDTLDTRANSDQQLQQVYGMATDPYASLRSLYLQNRKAQITGGKVDVNALPSFDDTGAGAPNPAGAPGAAPGQAAPDQPAPGASPPPQPQAAPSAAPPESGDGSPSPPPQ